MDGVTNRQSNQGEDGLTRVLRSRLLRLRRHWGRYLQRPSPPRLSVLIEYSHSFELLARERRQPVLHDCSNKLLEALYMLPATGLDDADRISGINHLIDSLSQLGIESGAPAPSQQSQFPPD